MVVLEWYHIFINFLWLHCNICEWLWMMNLNLNSENFIMKTLYLKNNYSWVETYSYATLTSYHFKFRMMKGVIVNQWKKTFTHLFDVLVETGNQHLVTKKKKLCTDITQSDENLPFVNIWKKYHTQISIYCHVFASNSFTHIFLSHPDVPRKMALQDLPEGRKQIMWLLNYQILKSVTQINEGWQLWFTLLYLSHNMY